MVKFHNIEDGQHIAGDHSNLAGSEVSPIFPNADDLQMGDVLYWDDTAFEWREVEGTKAPGYVLGLDADLRLRWIDIGAVGEPTPDPPPPPPAGDSTEPDAPTGLSAVRGDRRIILNWDDNVESDLAFYNVYWAAASGGPYVLLTTRATSDHVVTGLTNGDEYWFKIAAVDTSGNESTLSSSDSATPDLPDPDDVTVPDIPTGLEAVGTDRTVTLNWDDAAESDFASYAVYRASQSGGPFVLLTTRTVSSYINSGLTNGTTYYYKVSTVDQTGNESDPTDEVPGTAEVPIDTIPPPIPTGLSAVKGNTTITLNWSDSPASDWENFQVWRSDTSGGTYVLIATRTASDFTDTGLTNGEDYFYKIIAVDTAGNPSAFSAIASATPSAPAPGPGTGADGYPTYANRQVTINVGDSIQTKIDANPSGTIYGFAAGNHMSAGAAGQFTPKGGDKFVGETDGSGVPTSFLKGNWNETQFGGGVTSPFTGSLPSGVQMIRLDFSLYASAIGQSAMNSGNSWTYWKCYGHHCKSSAFRLGISGLISGGKCFDNGETGIFAHHPATNGIIEHMEIYDNNLQEWNDPREQAGGLKLVGPQGLLTHMTTRHCHVHHNNGSGIWYDQNGGYHTIEDNISEFNTMPGIHYEICQDGPAWIRRNIVRYNGDAADLYVSNSRGLPGNPIVVEDNTVYNHATTGLATHTEIWMADSAARVVRLGYVTLRRNRVARAPRSGWHNYSLGQYFSAGAPGIVINDNDYFTDVVNGWQWGDVAKNWVQWQALGYDTIGSKNPYQDLAA